MESGLIFRRIRKAEVPVMFQMIIDRMKWMDDNHLHHWNDVDYTHMYPLTYYEQACDAGAIYVLVCEETEEVVCAGVLLEEDSRWPDSALISAYYIHNLVGKTGVKGAGSRFIEEAENLARTQGKQYVRLDVLNGCEELANYYEKRGYVVCGTCEEENYSGILREKKL